MSYVARAEAYIEAVMSGDAPACKYLKRACERQITDLAKSAEQSHDFPFFFDADEAELRCEMVERLPHIKGVWSSPNLKLEDWQCFLLCLLFGWKRRGTNSRRFRQLFLFVARKNGKTSLIAAIAIICLLMDKEVGAEIYSAATKEKQAREVFDTAKAMVNKLNNDDRFKSAFGLDTHSSTITQPTTNSKMGLVSKQADTLDGLNIHVVTMDEVHAWKSADLYDVLIGGTAAREQPLSLVITTAGFILDGLCVDELKMCRRILDGDITNDSYLAVIFEGENEEGWATEDEIRKANPNYGISVQPQFIKDEIAKAMAEPSRLSNFLTKHLNIFQGTRAAYFNMEKWRASPNDGTKLADYAGCPCWIGIDLAQKWDLCSVAYLFDKNGHKKLFTVNYIPKARTREDHRLRAQYQLWVKNGYMVATDGEVTDYEYILRDVRKAQEDFDVRCLNYDPSNANELANRWSVESYHPVHEVPQTAKYLSEPQKKFGAWIMSGELDHGQDPCLTWQATNVVVRQFADETILFRKEKPEYKIDACVAASMAIFGHMTYGPEERPRKKKFDAKKAFITA